jgi:heptosyltransferase I
LLKSAIPIHFATAKQKLGYHWQREGARFFTQPVMPDPASIHVVDQYVDVARAAGGSTITDFGLSPTPESDQSINNLLSEFDSTKKLVICHAGAGWASKRWPAKNFAALADSLAAEATVAFIGTPADKPAVQEVLSHAISGPISLIGKTKVAELIALLSRADLHIAGDTGSIHIAAGLGRPCLGLYTLTKPHRSCPYGQLQNSLTTDLEEVTQLAQGLLDQ